MQNEALTSLNSLYAELTKCNSNGNDNKTIINNCDYTSDDVVYFHQELINGDIGKNLFFVINRYGEKMDKQTIDNLLSFLEHLLNEKPIVEQCNTAGIGGVFDKLLSNKNASSIEQIERILNKLNKT